MELVALFDKSFLQSMSVDESVWFDRHYKPLICPIFYVETLSNLAKNPSDIRQSEQLVETIAAKFPELSGSPCVDHASLAIHDLLGEAVPMDGRIPLTGGRTVKTKKGMGIVFDQSPEAEAFARWQKGEFIALERDYASGLRKSLSSLDLTEPKKFMQRMGINGKVVKSLEDAKSCATAFVDLPSHKFEILRIATIFLNMPARFQDPITERWKLSGQPRLRDFAPYAAYVLTIEIFFEIALAADLISSARPSNRLDIAYAFYLPFCDVFVSGDKLHRKCIPLFLRENQEFIWGPELKQDLNKLNAYYLKFPDDERERGILAFASGPPKDKEFLTSKLYDRLSPNWRRPNPSPRLTPEETRRIVESSRELQQSTDLLPGRPGEDYNNMSIARSVHARKGSWWQLPKDIKTNKN